MNHAPGHIDSNESACEAAPVAMSACRKDCNALAALVRLLARQAAHEFLRKPHETDYRSVEPPGSAA